MKLSAYLKDRVFLFVLHFLCMIGTSVYLAAIGNGYYEILLLIVIWSLIFFIYLCVSFYSRKQYFEKLQKTFDRLEQRHLFAEIMERPLAQEDLFFYSLIRKMGKSMTEQVTAVKNERGEYKEYIEQWVHEIKTPISVMTLICQNNKSELTRRILSELEKTDSYVEQALFYARSEAVEKDFIIKKITLSECVYAAVMRNKQVMIQNDVRLDIGPMNSIVYTDRKWLEFILHQILINAVQYKKAQNAVIQIQAYDHEKGTTLIIEDNGAGIHTEDIPRIFEKGFTGQKGRQNQKSTGIGLYLCKRLCEKMGLTITAEAHPGEYTKMSIFFPKGEIVQTASLTKM